MTVLVKNTGSRMARWFRRLTRHNKPKFHWYDVDHRGM